MSGPVLSIEQSGLACRAALFSADRRLLATAREDLTPIRPKRGRIEVDPEEIWSAAIATSRAVLVQARVAPGSLSAIGIAGDPGTAILWDRETGAPFGNGIAAADRRTESRCESLRAAEVEGVVRSRTGLRLDSGRAGTRLAWILDNHDDARRAAESGRAAFGDSASYLLWRLTDRRVHATDATSAAATLLFNLARQNWDETLLDVFGVSESILPAVFDNSTYFGAVDSAHFGGSGPVGIHGMAAAPQAALIGQAGIAAGATSVSFADGCSVLLSTGAKTSGQANREEVGLACRLNGKASFTRLAANPGAIDGFTWVARVLSLGEAVREADHLAGEADPEHAVYVVPPAMAAGYPWLRARGRSRGIVVGVTPDTAASDLARAGLESVGFAVNDIVEALERSAGGEVERLRVSGGLAHSDRAMQFLADICGKIVERPKATDAALIGAAWLAAAGAGIWPDNQTFVTELPIDRHYVPAMTEDRRRARIAAWRKSVGLALAAGDS